MRRSGFCLAIGLGVWSVSPRAGRADCSNGATYRITVAMNAVTICPSGTARQCGSSIDLLRQSAADGSVVVVGNACSSTSAACYVDQCVPPGTYRYGYATPYDCSEAGCGSVALFSQAEVTNPLPTGCVPASAAPTATSAPPPWPNGPADANVSRFKTCGSGGCTYAAASDRGLVRLLDALAVALGLGLIAVRARRRTRARPAR